jgi:hypothetical protein
MEGLYKFDRAQIGSICWNGKPVLWPDLNDGGAGGLSRGVGFDHYGFPQRNPEKDNNARKSN